jgi:hypothetical protein
MTSYEIAITLVAASVFLDAATIYGLVNLNPRHTQAMVWVFLAGGIMSCVIGIVQKGWLV